MNEETLKKFGAAIQRLINKEDMGRVETYALMKEVLTNTQPDLQQGAFLAALVSKGETVDEIVGVWQAICDFDTVGISSELPGRLVENSGTGMDSLKTFNVSSAAAIVAAACGAAMARHGARALTSFCGTVDILESVGVDVECDVNTVARSIIDEGIGLFNGMSPEIHPSALGRILSQIRFGSTLNIAASLANPARPNHALRGVYAETMVPMLAQIMPEMGYARGMVVHGRDDRREGGMDEISITGETLVTEFKGPSTSSSVLRPEDVGLATARFEEIATTGDLKKETARFLQVLAGNGHKACVDFTTLNAGAILYVAGIAPDIRSGVDQSREAIEKGLAMKKLERWVSCQSRQPEKGLERFEAARAAAKLKSGI